MPSLEKRLFLVSTPLHLLVSLAIIGAEKLLKCGLVFIDQVAGKDNVYLQTLNAWDKSPFDFIKVFYRPRRGAPLTKLRQRKATFKHLQAIIEDFQPQHIYVGNDRRIEFQYCMQAMQRLGNRPYGYYLDEGIFTYLGRQASFSFSDKYLDNLIKKLSYGWWWKHPATVGASAWIDTVYASLPEQVHPLLKAKSIKKLSLEYWQTARLIDFCQRLLNNLANGINFNQYDTIVTLPHESIIKAQPGYAEHLQQIITLRLKQGHQIAIKYHPRDTQIDALSLAQLNKVDLLPAAIPFEAMLPMLKNGVEVLGDFSTALITARLLRPDALVNAIVHQGADAQEEFENLYQRIGVNCIEI